MRKPTTPMGREWDWWRAALAGEEVVELSDPHVGYYARHLYRSGHLVAVERGPWVPVKIWWHSVVDPTTGELTEPETMKCLVNLEPADVDEHWFHLWPITREAYGERLALIEWAKANSPDHPVLHPMRPLERKAGPRVSPIAGWYRVQMVRQGPWMPARVFPRRVVSPETGREIQSKTMLCEIGQKPVSAYEWWPRLKVNPITRAEYDEMIDLIEWAGSNDPTHPVLNPEQPIDLTRRVSCPTTT